MYSELVNEGDRWTGLLSEKICSSNKSSHFLASDRIDTLNTLNTDT